MPAVPGAASTAGAGAPPTEAHGPFRRILLALDAGAHGPRIPIVLRELCDRERPDLVVVHVAFTSTSVAADAADGTPANAAEAQVVHELRGALVQWFGAPGESVPIRVLHGDPGERICEHAEYADCDLVVLEARPRTGFAGRWKGSVSRYVVSNSRRSVLVIGA